MSKVFLLDASKRPLDPIHPGHARKLLTWGKAAVFRRFPFTLILKGEVAEPTPEVQPLRVKLDPGSRTTGIALVNDATGEVVFAAELTHRGQQIRDALLSRRQIRRGRRNRKTRYRPARFLNRKPESGWLPPSLESRIANIVTWVKRLMRLAAIGAISQELVRFDTQALQNPEISGVEYQQGELAGYELREYLLEKWGRKCAYCGVTNVPLQVEHIVPRARGGTNRVGNLTLACEPCNLSKGTRTAAEFGHPNVQARAKAPLKDAAAVNQTRWALYRALAAAAAALPVEMGSGGLTKYNRIGQGLAKTHWTDAACVGASTPQVLVTVGVKPLLVTAKGHGNRAMCRTDTYGFPRAHRTRQKEFFGFRTGDIVRAVVPSTSKKAGRYVGRVAVRASGSFDLTTATAGAGSKVSGISHRYLKLLQRADGFGYCF
jgi:5-methylcytosine-specific restriction endonuclease McrA